MIKTPNCWNPHSHQLTFDLKCIDLSTLPNCKKKGNPYIFRFHMTRQLNLYAFYRDLSIVFISICIDPQFDLQQELQTFWRGSPKWNLLSILQANQNHIQTFVLWMKVSQNFYIVPTCRYNWFYSGKCLCTVSLKTEQHAMYCFCHSMDMNSPGLICRCPITKPASKKD